MTTGATGQLGLALPVQGELSGTWGDTVNNGITQYTNIAIAGTLTLTGDGAVTLANTTGDASASNITSTLAGAGTVTAQFAVVRVSGTTGVKTVTGPSYSKSYIIDNASSYAVTFKASGQTGVSISPGEKVGVYYNGTDYVKIGGGGITYGAVKTSTYTAVSNDGVLTNTTGGAFTVNLPASPSTGTQVFIADANGTWGTNNLTVGRNGSTIAGSATDLVCDINSVSIQFVYTGTTWDIFAQIGANDTAVVTLNGTQTLTNKTLTAPTITSPTVTGTGTIAAATVTLSSTLAVTGVATLSSDALVNGLTVGRGAGADASNTAVGASALTANTTGTQSTATGNSALIANTSGIRNSAFGFNALLGVTTGNRNTGIGRGALLSITTDSDNTAVGTNALFSFTSGSYNTAVGSSALQGTSSTGSNNSALGYQALFSNTTASNNTAVGYQAGYANTTGEYLEAVGWSALRGNTTGVRNSAFGTSAMYTNTSGSYNIAMGFNALSVNTTGSNNVGLGYQSLYSNTTASNNTAVGYQAGYSTTTGTGNVIVGKGAGYTSSGGSYNTYIGTAAGNSSTGNNNQFIGNGAGRDITGSGNSVLGNFSGNQGGLDIRTASNYIVLSDGDGNPYAQCNTSFWKFGIGGTGAAYGGGSLSLNGSTASGYQTSIGGYGNGTAYWTVGTKGAIDGSASTFLQCQNTGGGVYLNGASATSWTAVSDERLKENLVDITDAAAKVSTLRAVVGNYTWDEEKARKPFLIAQDVQAVLPEAVSASRQIKGDETEYLGVSYTEVIPLLVAAIKELKAEIDILKGNV